MQDTIQLTEDEWALLKTFSQSTPRLYDFDKAQCLAQFSLIEIHHSEGNLEYWVLSRRGALLLEERYKAETAQAERRAQMKPLEELKRIANAAEARAVLAEQEAKDAKHQAIFATVLSALSLLCSVGMLIFDFLEKFWVG